jgi:hypothetical protein
MLVSCPIISIQYDIYSFGNPTSFGNTAIIKEHNSYSTPMPSPTLTTWS